MSSSLRDDVAALEFGRYLRLGHSARSTATMKVPAHGSAVTLASYDKRGRCQVYGHAHGYWGGC